MKKIILTVILMITSITANAQGIITVKDKKSEVPIEQWYVIAKKDFVNHSFYYAKHNETRDELIRILKENNQSIEFPKGTDNEGDLYWVIYYENEFTSYFYLSKDGNSEFSNITVVTK